MKFLTLESLFYCTEQMAQFLNSSPNENLAVILCRTYQYNEGLKFEDNNHSAALLVAVLFFLRSDGLQNCIATVRALLTARAKGSTELI
jgi:hypothetical protein